MTGEQILRQFEPVIKGKNMKNLKTLLYSHIHGWARVGDIEKILVEHGYVFEELKRHNRTDGEYHKRISKDGVSFELNANIWDNKTFQPLLDWLA